MSSQLLELLSKVFFSGSVLVVIYLVYYEWKSAKIRAEDIEIKLGERENEDLVNSLSDSELVTLANKNLEQPTKFPPAPNNTTTKK